MRTDPLAGRRLLLLICGSIAAVKLPLLVSALVQRGAQVRCVLSPAAARLVSPVALACLSRHPCHLDEDQWSHQAPRPLHVELAEWAELVLLAPLTATTLGRWLHGLGDSLLASTLLACEAPVLVAPAMNTAMWASPGVRRNWETLQTLPQLLPLPPGRGLLACDRRGDGRMADPELLQLALESLLCHGWQRDWQGRHLLVTAGPTREALDPARCLTNPSSGRMGVLLAQAARLRGAEVTLIHGPLSLPAALLEGLEACPILSAADLQRALRARQAEADAIAMVAAVADHRRASPHPDKLAKEELAASLAAGWEPVPDLLAELAGRRPPGQAILGFAAYSGEGLAAAAAKRQRKGCDLLFANPIDQPGSGFGADDNQGWLLGPGDQQRRLEPAPKLAIAHRLLDALLALDPLLPAPAQAARAESSWGAPWQSAGRSARGSSRCSRSRKVRSCRRGMYGQPPLLSISESSRNRALRSSGRLERKAPSWIVRCSCSSRRSRLSRASGSPSSSAASAARALRWDWMRCSWSVPEGPSWLSPLISEGPPPADPGGAGGVERL